MPILPVHLYNKFRPPNPELCPRQWNRVALIWFLEVVVLKIFNTYQKITITDCILYPTQFIHIHIHSHNSKPPKNGQSLTG